MTPNQGKPPESRNYGEGAWGKGRAQWKGWFWGLGWWLVAGVDWWVCVGRCHGDPHTKLADGSLAGKQIEGRGRHHVSLFLNGVLPLEHQQSTNNLETRVQNLELVQRGSTLEHRAKYGHNTKRSMSDTKK